MAKVNLDVPDSLHRKVRQLQLDLEEQEQKFSLKDLYYHVIEKGLTAIEKERSEK
jgi:hypothetical protein